MILPQKETERFVERYFRDRDAYIRLARKKGTPLYVLEPMILKERAAEFRTAFRDEFDDCRFYFAVKSNNHPAASETLLGSGFGLDVSSGNELETALSLGALDIVFTGPGKTAAELGLAVENHEKVTILADSFHEFHAIEKIAASQQTAVRVGVRLTTDTAGSWRKFGIALDDLPFFLEQAEGCTHAIMEGLQFHTSWNLTPERQCEFIGLLGKEMAACPDHARRRIRFIDIGGGYWPRQGEWLHADPAGGDTGREEDCAADFPQVHYYRPAASIEAFAREIGKAIRKNLDFLPPCSIWFEPGRWICHDSMHFLITVMDRKAPDLVIADGGINSIGWERFDTDYFPVLNLTRPSLDEKRCTVCGSLCTPHDNFGFFYFGRDIRAGDVLMIPCQGAYTYSLRQDFIKPAAGVTILSKGTESFV